MITLISIAIATTLLCVAAAGLIASTQSEVDGVAGPMLSDKSGVGLGTDRP